MSQEQAQTVVASFCERSIKLKIRYGYFEDLSKTHVPIAMLLFVVASVLDLSASFSDCKYVYCE